ncbi:MAG: hypothetical protein HY774_28500 [Acidobacteria bacterium]|nr:hypothetical protein [Acidobacteriota bacterium]
MSSQSTSRRNPYVGPRPYCPGETLFGRDQEILDLFDLLLAERIVLMYSPSGAGKSSLIEAGLRPKLQEEGFEVFPTLRVSFVPVTSSQHPETSNRYILSLLLSLEEGLPRADRWNIEQLSSLTLEAYLNQRWAGHQGDKLKVLFFDQFEEILTLNPVDQDVKIEFFKQIGQVLRNPEVWVLFSMREEFVPALDPFLYLVPTRLKTRFRLELLTKEAAAEAIQKPAHSQGVTFTNEAARYLTEDLAKIVIQDLDGNKQEEIGNHIEPVQLQVVCYNLWEKLSGKKEITEADIKNRQVGNVDAALGEYYAQTVEAIAQSKTTESPIRLWFENHLITRHGIRGQVIQEPQASQGLSNQTIKKLVDAHLVRAERRLGSTWYELSHDRLIQPVLENNKAWFESNLTLLQKQAMLWQKQGYPESLLLRGQDLERARTEIDEQQIELTPNDQEFLNFCEQADSREQHRLKAIEAEARAEAEEAKRLLEVEARKQAETRQRLEEEARKQAEVRQKLEEERRIEAEKAQELETVRRVEAEEIALQKTQAAERLKWASRLALFTAVCGVLFGGGFVLVAKNRSDAAIKRLTDEHKNNLEAARVKSEQDTNLRVDTIVKDAENKRTQTIEQAEKDKADAVKQAIEKANQEKERIIAEANRKRREIEQKAEDEKKIAVGEAVKAATKEADIKLVKLLEEAEYKKQRIIDTEKEKQAEITRAANANLAASEKARSDLANDLIKIRGDYDGTLKEIKQEIEQVTSIQDLKILQTKVATRIAALIDGTKEDFKTVQSSLSQNVAASNPPTSLPFIQNNSSLSLDQDGSPVFVTPVNKTVQVLDKNQSVIREFPTELPAPAVAGTISNNRMIVAASSTDNKVRIWNWNSRSSERFREFNGFKREITALAFSPDDKYLAAGSEDEQVKIWDLNKKDTDLPIFDKNLPGNVYSVVFSPDGKYLAAGDNHNNVYFYEISTEKQIGTNLEMPGNVVALSWVKYQGQTLLAAAGDEVVRLWTVDINGKATPFGRPLIHKKDVITLALSQNGEFLEVITEEKQLYRWNVQAVKDSVVK